MKKLSKEQDYRRRVIAARLVEKRAELLPIFEKINAIILAELNPTIIEFNEVIVDAAELHEDVLADMDDYLFECSENWLGSARGQAYHAWKDNWDIFPLEPVDEVLEIETPDLDHADLLLELPNEPSIE